MMLSNFMISIKRIALLSVALYALPLLVDRAVNDTTGLQLDSFVQAQTGTKQQPRRLPGISEKMFKSLGQVAELAQPPEGSNKQPDFKAALREAKEIEKRCTSCNPYELSQVYNYLAWISYSLEDSKSAIKYYNKVLAQSPQIPWGLELQTRFTLSQLSFAEGDYRDALNQLNDWMKVSSVIGADAYQFKATICYQLKDKACALKEINRAISMIEAKGDIAKEPWYNLQRAIFFEDEDYKAALKNLHLMVKHYPKKSYWTQMGGVYGLLGDEVNQLAALEAAYLMGALTKETELVNLAYMYLNADTPDRAAKVMEKGLKNNIIKPSAKNLEVLGIAHRSAKNIKDAISAMEKAAAKSDNGDIYGDLVALYMDIDQAKEAIEAGKKARKKGELRDPEIVNLNMGIAYVELKQFSNAISAFDRVLADKDAKPSVRKFATSWKQHSENEKYREEELAKAI